MPGSKQHLAAFFSLRLQLTGFGQSGSRRLLQQHRLARRQRLAGQPMAQMGRGADGDRIDARICLQHGAEVSVARDALQPSVRVGACDQFKSRRGGNRRHHADP